MAQFYAISAADIVGSSTVSPPFPSVAAAVTGSTNAFFQFFPPAPPADYTIFNTNGGFLATSSITSFTNFASPTPFVVGGAGHVNHVWKADSGDSYLLGTAGTASLDTYFGLVFTPKTGAPTLTHGTEQQINQFFFKFEDRIHGSEEDDMLCGWAEDDQMWGGEGDDQFYYGEGMGIDQIMDFNKKDDEVIFDEDLYDRFGQLRKDVKLKNDSVVVKFDSDTQLTIYGIDTLKELKKTASFDDFTDFS
jgi:hypothetical protein